MLKFKSLTQYKEKIDNYTWRIDVRVYETGAINSREALHYNGKQSYQIKKHTLNKKLAVEYKGGKCAMCGIKSKHYEIYDFHHIDSKTKKFGIGEILHKNFSDIISELNKTIMLCANCHRILHKNEV